MANEKDNRGFELVGDSPELIAFVILKSVIQLEQGKGAYDKAKLLSTYAECLDAVKGNYKAATAPTPSTPAARKSR